MTTSGLPISGFISGRVATERDVQDGNAVFYLEADGFEVRPCAIDIPQYAIWTDENTTEKRLVVLIQAEEVDGGVTVGLRKPDGGEIVATLPELELLGTKTSAQ